MEKNKRHNEALLTLTEEYKIQRAIEKVFIDNHNKYSPVDEENWFITCPANVSLIIAKSDYGKKLLLRFLNIDDNGKPMKDTKSPSLDYFTKELEIPKVKISMEYLTNILEIFKYDDAVSITLKHDYPITIENNDFKCIIAPRVEGED
jgi:hypothetical protein